ncbi:glycosyltransferase [Heyndrickxia coagulans]|uniref:glycosyltransferase n=1 Tax=Heyndrickxia coagulans TaxID=1398 RepID=UPI002E1B3941|nr:glycosyltransferase [Heyndrickxia coagulans]MED4967017.1 glycosyltransferase [Heyndrickxia coagulans]
MKILHIITGLDYGGAEKLLLDTCVELKKRNNDVYVVYLKTEGNMVSQFKQNGIPTKKISMSKNVIFTLVKLVKFIKVNKFQVVHTHCAHANILGRIAAFICGIDKIVTTLHNTDRWLASNKISMKLIKKIDTLLMKSKKSVSIAISRSVKQYTLKYENINEKKIRVLPNAININSIINKSKADMINDLDLFKKDNFVVINVGRLVKQKGQINLILAMQKIIKEHKILNIKCLIIGEGEERKKLEGIIEKFNLSNNVFLLGQQENPYKYMKKSDLFVIPSLWEGFGIVILEAFALGLPVVGSNVDGISEIIENNKSGILVNRGNSEELCNVILNFYNGCYPAQTFVRNAKSKLKHYSIQNYVNQLIGIYKE